MSAPSAEEFARSAEETLRGLSIEASRAGWVYETYINLDTEALTAKADARLITAAVELAKRSAPFAAHGESVAERKIRLVRLSQSLLTPSNPRESEELTQIVAAMRGEYGKGKYQPKGASTPLDLEGLSRVLATSRDPAELLDIWTGWHAVARPMRPKFLRYVELANKGAREVGFADTGEMWRSKYDMAPEEFAHEARRLWAVVQPLYRELHAYVRWRLSERYGPAIVAPERPIPAHLLGNMWAQSWEHVLDLVAPASADPGVDLDGALRRKGVDEREMVRIGERFFVSLGLDPLPASFWERSQFARPADRDVVCHASAWAVDFDDDVRLKMCIERTAEDFHVIHHELGHTFYQRGYRHQPFLFRDSANDGFHEAIGDTISLSITPEYLSQIGLLDAVPPADGDLGILLERALDRVAFLPFGLLIDEWRWRVFDASIAPSDYTTSWWSMRREYQGIEPGVARTEADFDPGAKFHVSSNVPYMRYFLAFILQFQFHRALARLAGHAGPLHRFSIYGNAEAGRRLKGLFAMGVSRPWPEALEALTGESRMDPTAILEYFDPLRRWLRAQNQGHPMGW